MSSSSSEHRLSGSSLHERVPSKIAVQVQDFELDMTQNLGLATPRPKETWRTKLIQRLKTRYPLTHSRFSRVIKYCRGPRPKVTLTDPRPLLDVDRTIRHRRIYLPLESLLIRLTTPLTKPWLLLILVPAYIISFAFFSRAQSFFTPPSSFIDCTSTYWFPGNGCGLNGASCAPFNDSSLDFRCPAQCSSVILQNPRTIGDQQVAFVPLIVGGGDANGTYRGDSFICAAALQAGLISDNKGGCASLQLIGNFTDFLPKTANGLSSIGFDSVFPLSFQFLEHTTLSHCEDNRDAALAFNILITCFVFLILRPKPIIMFWSLVCIGFWHVTLFSQPRGSPPPISDAFGDFLPSLFICYAFWRLAFRFTLPAFSKAPIEATVWYLAPFWAGVLTNLVTDKIPIDRLTSSDLHKRSGAITALVIIVLIITAMVINQIRVIRKTGWLPYYLGWYIIGGLVAMVLALLPGLQLRLHHYILSMVLIPGTGFPTRLSAIYQGFLLGMFLNGAAAFGLDSILQTPTELLQDAPLGSALPSFITNSTNYNASIPFGQQTLFWNALPDGWDGFSLLVDDVERYVGTALNFSLAAFDATIPHFFRLALTSSGDAGDYTMAATIFPNGTFVDPPPGPS